MKDLLEVLGVIALCVLVVPIIFVLAMLAAASMVVVALGDLIVNIFDSLSRRLKWGTAPDRINGRPWRGTR